MYSDIKGMPIQDVLRAWGRWKPINRPQNGYTKPSIYTQMVNPGDDADRYHTPEISEDFGAAVETAVNEMKAKKPTHHAVIVAAYLDGLMDYQVAKHRKFPDQDGKLRSVSRSWVRTMRENAEHWLEAKLDG